MAFIKERNLVLVQSGIAGLMVELVVHCLSEPGITGPTADMNVSRR